MYEAVASVGSVTITGKVNYTPYNPTFNDIQIAEQHVSRQHAVIQYRDGFFMINDLASSNGTFVNDQAVQAEKSDYVVASPPQIRSLIPKL